MKSRDDFLEEMDAERRAKIRRNWQEWCRVNVNQFGFGTFKMRVSGGWLWLHTVGGSGGCALCFQPQMKRKRKVGKK